MMRIRAERTVKELYDLTRRISEPEITPILKGTCRIQGPADDLDFKKFQGTNSVVKKIMSSKDCSGRGIESGTCTVCSAPCSLCLHYNSENGYSCNLTVRTEADSSSVNNVGEMPIYSSRICEELHPTASEASNLVSSSSSHDDSYLENAESKANARASASYDEVTEDELSLHRFPLNKDVGQEDKVVCLKGAIDPNVIVSDTIGAIEKKGMASEDPSLVQNDRNLALVENEKGNMLFIKDEPMDINGVLNLLPQAEIRCDERDNYECPSASMTGGTSGISSVDGLQQDTILCTDCKKQCDDCFGNDLESDGAVLNTAKCDKQQIETQTVIGNEKYELDAVLDDVKVCDICGDAGREDHLATCSRCSDGAEHTYCMREMLDKVPEGEWLCEECKTMETENQDANECEVFFTRMKSACLNDANQNLVSASIPKKARKLGAKIANLHARESTRILQGSLVSNRRQADDFEEGKAFESCASVGSASPRKLPVLSRQILSKNQDMGKEKAVPSGEVELSKDSDALIRLKNYLNSNSFKGLPPLHSPHGKLSRSVSFNNSNVNPKVKTLIENVSSKQKHMRDPTIDFRKEGVFKLSTKAAFKSTAFESCNTELANKISSFQSSRIEDLSTVKDVKQNAVVKKYSTKGNSSVRPTAAVTSNYSLSVDTKSEQNKGLHSGSIDENKQIPCSSKAIESSNCNYDADNLTAFKVSKEAVWKSVGSVHGLYKKSEIIIPNTTVQPLESFLKDIKPRDSTIFIGSKLSVGNRASHSQRGNEAGRPTQAILGGFAQKNSAEQNLRTVERRDDKCRDVVNATTPRSGVLKSEKVGTLEELPRADIDTIFETALKNARSVFNQRTFSFSKTSLEDSTNASTKTLAAISSLQQVELPIEVRDSPTVSDLAAKPFTKAAQGQIPLLAKPSSGSAVPKFECIWQGSFNVIGTGSCSKMFFGIQAHLSTCASHRVFQLANKVPVHVVLEEVSHNSSWPLRSAPQEENIALFFFAKDIESYEKSYLKLMDKMHKNDLALRGKIDGTDLLIFTSTKLPISSQSWNRMHYLWGTFRVKRRYCLPATGDQKSLLSNQDLSKPSITASNVWSLGTSANHKELRESVSFKGVPGEYSNALNLSPLSLDIEDKTLKALGAFPVQSSLNNMPTVPQETQKQLSFSVGSSSGTKTEFLGGIIETPSSRLKMSTSISRSKEEINDSQEKFISYHTRRKPGDLSVFNNEIDVETCHGKGPSVPSISLNCNKGSDCLKSEEKNVEKDNSSPSGVAVIYSDGREDVLGTDLDSEPTISKKRDRSCSMERASDPSEKMSENSFETVLPGDILTLLPVEDERELKKACHTSACSPIDANITRAFSKVHPSHSSFLSKRQQVDDLSCESSMPQSMRTTERSFFPLGLNSLQNVKYSKIIHFSTKGENGLDLNNPDLELALGEKRKTAKPFPFPSLFNSVDGGKKHLEPGTSGDADDAPTSLSLSL